MTADDDIYDGRSRAAIAARLRLTRDIVGLSQRDFAIRAGLKPSNYNHIEAGNSRPSIDAALRLCDAYKLTLDWIFRGDSSNLVDPQMIQSIHRVYRARSNLDDNA